MSGKFQIFHDDYLDATQSLSFSASSEQAVYPAENVRNVYRRSKVWRSEGYWLVRDGYNMIYFEDNPGVTRVCTVTPGEYTTAGLLAAIDAGFEAAGLSNYTVTHDASTFKFTLASALAGGAVCFNIAWDALGQDLADLLGFEAGSTLTGASSYTADEARISTGEWIKGDLGQSSIPKAFAAIGPKGQDLKISPTAVITLQMNSVDSWDAPAFEQVVPWHAKALLLADPAGLPETGLRYWRLLIEDLSNALGYTELGITYLGDLFTPTRGAARFPFRSVQVDRTVVTVSEGGHTFGDPRQQTTKLILEIDALTNAEKESLEEIFERFGLYRPFFVSLDPEAVFSSSAQVYCKYVKFSAEPEFSLDAPGVWSTKLELQEEA
jgi:hypothetical protein